MTLLDLLFLAVAICTLGILATACVQAVRGRGFRALRILGIWAICAAVYSTAGLGISLFRPQRMISIGESWCFDDWCLAVERAQRTATAATTIYKVDLLLHSRARRVAQRALGAWIYMIDAQGRRFAPDPDASAVPLDVLLQAGESIETTRTFRLPPGARGIGVVTGHGGPYCGAMSLLVLGDSGCVFQKPTMISIN